MQQRCLQTAAVWAETLGKPSDEKCHCRQYRRHNSTGYEHEERYGRRSTIITSQLPVESWHAVIGDPTYADAILDRLVHNAQRLNLSGDSLRRTRTKSNAKS
jgi:hypothetical protein